MGYYRKNFWKFCGGLFIAWLIPFLISEVGQKSIRPQMVRRFVGLLEAGGDGVWMSALRLGAFCAACFLFFNLMNVAYEYFDRRAARRSIQKISADLYEYIYGQSIRFYADMMPGKIAKQIEYISDGHKHLYSFGGKVLAFAIILCLNVGLAFELNWKIGTVLIVGTAFRIIWSVIMTRPMLRAYEKFAEQGSYLSGRLIDSISNFMVVKLFAGRERETEIARPEREKTAALGIRSSFFRALFWIVPSTVEDLLLVGVILAAIGSHAIGQVGVAEVAFTITVYEMLSGMLWQIVWGLPDTLDAYSTASEAYRKIIQPVEIADNENASKLTVREGLIRIKKVSFDYREQKGCILDDFSLDIKPGERVGLVGLSGGGKTTLVNLIMRLYDPKRGQIEIDGQDIRRVTQDSLHRSIAFIPQDSVLFNRTLAENIAYGRHNARRADIIAAAKKAGAHDFIMDAPKKYDSMVGDRGIKLSGGQRQRIAIARAIIKDAPILIMDEATSALDSETEAVVQKSFQDVSKGKTTIVIAHRLSTLRNMDRIVVLDCGVVAESGTHARLLKKNGIYAKLWKLQSGGFIKS